MLWLSFILKKRFFEEEKKNNKKRKEYGKDRVLIVWIILYRFIEGVGSRGLNYIVLSLR